mmetsp:Transcript_13714/g.12426  ORF Transcript_13714/g.12426 Transcript_13714/m.12426 type:complete len:253 (+) Transcript_13714:66-824(+)
MPPKKKKIIKKKKKGLKKVYIAPLISGKELELPKLPDIKTTTFHSTVVSGDTSTISRLVVHYDYQDTLFEKDMNGSTAIHIAVKKNDFQTVVKLLDLMRMYNNNNTNELNILNCREVKSIGGNTAMHHAIKQNNTDILKLLLENNADPNIKSDSDIGDTPLHLCCRLGNTACAQLLINSGANVNAKDGFGHNPSYWATSTNHNDMIKLLNLPPGKSATANEFIQILLQKNKNFKLPSISTSTKKKTKKPAKK